MWRITWPKALNELILNRFILQNFVYKIKTWFSNFISWCKTGKHQIKYISLELQWSLFCRVFLIFHSCMWTILSSSLLSGSILINYLFALLIISRRMIWYHFILLSILSIISQNYGKFDSLPYYHSPYTVMCFLFLYNQIFENKPIHHIFP